MKTILTLFTLSVLLLGCNDFLDIRPEATVPSAGLDYTKEENIFLPVSAAYASLRGVHSFAYIGVFEIVSDDADKGSSDTDGPEQKELDNFTYQPTNGLINGVWTGFYNVSSAANYAIHTMPLFEAEMKTEEQKLYTRQCAAESKFIRAYAYFNLVRVFGKVPVIDTVMSAAQLAEQKQKSVTEVYDFIEKDLTDAVNTLPESYGKEFQGRINKYSAMALKAKVHLYQQEWDSVAVLTDKIMASGKYGLLTNFREVFSMEGENSRESLFEIQSSTLGQSNGSAPYCDYAYLQGPRNNTPSNMQGWGFKVPSQKLITFLTGRNETVRMATTLLYRGTKTPEGDSIKAACQNPVYNGKVYTPSAYNKWSYNGYGFDHNIRIMRYAEVLLMYAEALIQGAATGSLTAKSAAGAINEVRGRAGLGDITPTLDDVYDERRAELAMEENRFFDLIRTGRTSELTGFKPYNVVFPIPTNQRQLNTNLEPTPGYTY